jgi:hypothetical protein
MKKILTVVFTMLLAVSLAFAQDTGGDKASKTGTGGTSKDTTGKKPAATPSIETKTKTKTKSGKKGHKGGKKSKKGSSSTTTPPPK